MSKYISIPQTQITDKEKEEIWLKERDNDRKRMGNKKVKVMLTDEEIK